MNTFVSTLKSLFTYLLYEGWIITDNDILQKQISHQLLGFYLEIYAL